MVALALNQVSAPTSGWAEFAALAKRCGCACIELRNDLGRALFDGDAPERVKQQLARLEMTLIAVAQIDRFNDLDAVGFDAATHLIDQASAAGAEAIALIPRVDGDPIPLERTAEALRGLAPCLRRAGLRGYIEPVGFASSTVRSKADALAAMRLSGVAEHYALIHDTFHHHLADEAALFPEDTALVHISGVVRDVPAKQMTDADRGLVTEGDRLGTIQQLRALSAAGYRGPVSVEAFSPTLQALDDPASAIMRSLNHIRAQVAAENTGAMT